MDANPQPIADFTYRLRRRERMFALITFLISLSWMFGTYRVADHVRNMNATRLISTALTPTPGTGSRPAVIESLLSPPALRDGTSPAQAAAFRQIKRETLRVEQIATRWESAMSAVAGILVLLAALSCCTRYARPLHLVTAILVIAATGGTLWSMARLSAPDGGNLPPLSPLAYGIVFLVQTAYVWVLLIACLIWLNPRRHQPCSA